MSDPPPLPGGPRPSTSLVTVVGWVCLVSGVLGVLVSLTQVASGAMLPDDHALRLLAPLSDELPELPPLMLWYYTNTLLIGLLSLAVSVLLVVVGRGLLRRHEWARKAFIALLLLGTLWQLASIWAMPQFLEGMLVLQGASMPEGMVLPPQFATFMHGMLAVVALFVLLFAALHAWLVWKLCTARVRAEFEPVDRG